MGGREGERGSFSQALSFASEGVRFLACCDGGSFACAACVAAHSGGHALMAEVYPVRLAASLRRPLCTGITEAVMICEFD